MMLKMFWKHPRSSLYEKSWRGPIEKSWLQHSKSRLFSRRFFFFSVLYRSFSFLSPHALARIMLLSSNQLQQQTCFPFCQYSCFLGASYKINWNLLILKHCRKSNSKVYMYLIRTACKTSKSYLEVNPFMIHNIPHENKPFIVGGIFDKHVQV